MMLLCIITRVHLIRYYVLNLKLTSYRAACYQDLELRTLEGALLLCLPCIP